MRKKVNFFNHFKDRCLKKINCNRLYHVPYCSLSLYTLNCNIYKNLWITFILSFWSLSEDWQLWQLLIFLEYLDLEFVGLFFYIAYIIHILSFNSNTQRIFYLIISRKQFHIYIYIHIQVYIFNFPVYSNKLKYPLILSLLPSHLFPIK